MSRLIFSGDVCGNFDALFATVSAQLAKQPFDGLVCVGSFFAAEAEKFEYDSEVPILTYIVDSLETDCGCALAKTVPLGGQLELSKNLILLSPFFVGEICGLKFASLGGRNLALSAFEWMEANGGEDTDVFATSDWPDASPAVARVARFVKPQYIVCAVADIYHVGGWDVAEQICLGKVTGAMTKEKQWIHAVQIGERERVMKKQKVSEDIFVSNIPYDVSEVGLEGFLRNFFSKFSGFLGIKKVMVSRGFAILRFASADEALEAVDKAQDVRLGPRKLYVKISHGKGKIENNQVCSDSRPDCWFCLSNPKFDSHLIFGINEKFYAARAKGSLTQGHVVVCPVTHYGCLAQMPRELQVAATNFVNLVVGKAENFVVYERWVPMDGHMQIHCVPVEENNWVEIVKKKGRSVGIEFIRVKDHLEIVEKLGGLFNRVSYLFISVPTNKGPECFLGMGRLELTFPRELICSGTNKMDRVDWRKCLVDKEVEEKEVDVLKKSWESSLS